MTMESRQIVLQMKYSRIIAGIALQTSCTLEEAMSTFFHSDVFTMMQEGIADMHCRSDIYLIDEIINNDTTKADISCDA